MCERKSSKGQFVDFIVEKISESCEGDTDVESSDTSVFLRERSYRVVFTS